MSEITATSERALVVTKDWKSIFCSLWKNRKIDSSGMCAGPTFVSDDAKVSGSFPSVNVTLSHLLFL